MASESVASMHKKFSFMLEYMGRAMLLKTYRPKSYRVVNLCNIASLVLNMPQSPSTHYFRPRVLLPWAGREFDVFTEEVFAKVVNVCMVKGHFNLHMVVLFDVIELRDGSVERVEVPRIHLTNGEQPVVISDETCCLGMVNDGAKSPPMLGKRRYKCTKCSGIGHNKRACKVFKPTAIVAGPSAHAKGIVIDGSTTAGHNRVASINDAAVGRADGSTNESGAGAVPVPKTVQLLN